MFSPFRKRSPLVLIFLVILSRFDLIYCCSSSDDEASTTDDACEAGELGGGMVDETNDPKLPKFSWNITADTNMTEGPFLLNVDFHDGKTDVAILMPRMYDGELDTSILNGNLKEETPTVEVSVNGRPNDKTFDVTMHSKHHAGGIYQITEGKTSEIVQDPCIKDSDHDVKDSESSGNGNYSQNSRRGAPKTFTITLSLHYDNTFLKNVGKGSHSTAKHKIREIVNQAEPIFHSKSWKLGHQITLEELEIGHVHEDLALTSGDGKLDFISRKNGQRAKDADNYHYFAYDNKDGVSGRAYTGGLCSTSRRWRTGISEWIKSRNGIHYSENQCVLTFAHELGHALNMPHDFVQELGPGNCLTDRNGNGCCEKGTVMDYFQKHVNHWSTCSKEAMNRLDFGTSRCSSKGGPGTTPCQDEKRWKYYCDNVNRYGGCNGYYARVFKEHCKKTCNSC